MNEKPLNKYGSILFYDVETTGKADMKLPEDHPKQPRIVSLAAWLVDGTGREIHTAHLIVKPEGFTIPPEVTREVHGIGQDFALQHGLTIRAVITIFLHLAHAAELLVAFNDKFDKFLITGEARRLKFNTPFDQRRTFCMMTAMIDHCRLPKAVHQTWHTDKYKWPKLEEAYEHCFNAKPPRSHDALADVQNTAKVFWWYLEKTVADIGTPPLLSDQQHQSK